jgi:HEAT repeat protein
MMPRTVAAYDASAAVQALAHLTDSQALLAAARDPRPDVAHVALSRIAELDDRSAVTALRELLWSCDLAVARAVATTLARLDDEELEACARRRLGDARYPARLVALWTLEIVGDRDAASAVEPLIEDPISGVRATAAETLAALRPDQTTAHACAQLLGDDHADVRRRAVHAIGRCRGEIASLVAPAVRDPQGLVRREAARLATRLAPEHALGLLRDPDAQVRRVACRGSGRRETVALSDALAHDRDPEVRLAAAQTLGVLASGEAIPALVDALGDAAPVVRAASLRALSESLDRAAVLAVIASRLEHPAASARRAATYALAHLEAVEVAPLAAQLAHDPNADVRLALLHAAPALDLVASPELRALKEDPDSTVRHAAEMRLR